MTTNGMRAVIWCAVSSQDQADPDKASLPEQLRTCQEWCETNGYQVVSTLRVDGFSRSESDVITALEDFAEQGVTAYAELRKLWQTKAFDVLVAYHHSRLGRSSTLHSWVCENVILSGARIFLIRSGWIDQSSFRFQIAMGGNSSASEIDNIKDRYKMGMQKRTVKGLPAKRAPMSHVEVRDRLGKVIRLELNPATERLFEDLKNLILAGKPWRSVAKEMYYTYGHVNPATGKPMSNVSYFRLIHTPWVWGIAAQHYVDRVGIWVFDDSEPVPEGVQVVRNPEILVPSVYNGKDAELLKAELRRRHDSIKGHASPEHSHLFTGLLQCSICGYRFNFRRSGQGRLPSYRCGKYSIVMADPCSNNLQIREDTAQEQINDWLQLWLDAQRPDITVITKRSDSGKERAELIQADIDSLTKEIAVSMTLQRKASDAVQEDYAQEIRQLGARREILRERLKQVQREVEPTDIADARQIAYEELTTMTLPAFWQQDTRKINQTLHALLGDCRFIVDKAQITDLR